MAKDKLRTVDAEALKREINPDEEIINLREALKEKEDRLKEYKRAHGSLKTFFRDLKEAIPTMAVPKQQYGAPKKKSKVTNPVSAVMHDTDKHMGAVVEPSEIEDFGAFSPALCRGRAEFFTQQFIEWVWLHRQTYRCDEMVIISTGDAISGDIHLELSITNAFPAPVQVKEAGYLLADQIKMAAPHFAKVRVEFIVADNHSRLTKKPPSAEAGYNSLNYLVGIIAKQRVADFKNVEFNIYPMLQKVVEVQGRKYLCQHGHKIRGWAGFPWYGMQRKTGQEAIKRMLANRGKFDKIVAGHYHAPLAHPHFWIGASLQGTTAYDHGEGRYSPPAATGWMVHPKHGEFDRTDFNLQSVNAEE